MEPQLEKDLEQYLKTALWSSSNYDADGNNGEPFDNDYDTSDFTVEARKAALRDIKGFLSLCADRGIDLGPVYAAIDDIGHDFWLTRNRHGAGFWDRGLCDVGRQLTEIAHSFGPVDLYVTVLNQITFA